MTSTRQRRKVRVFASNVSAMSESEQNAPSASLAVSDRGDREALGRVAALPPVTIDKLLRLAALRLEESEKRELEADLVKIIELVDALRQVDTTDVAPLAHPLESVQPLRPDRITESVERGRYQDGAPLVRDGLYLVPRVVS